MLRSKHRSELPNNIVEKLRMFRSEDFTGRLSRLALNVE